MEIGSEFWWDERDINYEINNLSNKFQGAKFFDSGRGALYALLSHLKLSSATILLPEYICDSIIQPFFIHGFKIIYYKINRNLQPIINSNINMNLIDIFYNVDYFGFDTSGLIQARIKTANPMIITINDITHSWLSDFNKEYDYSVASIRKWFGIPSGGLLIGKDLPEWELPINKNFVELRKKALLEKMACINQKNNPKKYLELFKKAEDILDGKTAANGMDEASKNLLDKLNYNKIVLQRRSNYQYLLQHLNPATVRIIFNVLNETTCPLFFPIYIEDRDELRRYLIANEIYCPIHWPRSEKIDNLSDSAKYIYSHILSIQIDQRYKVKDMERIVYLINHVN